MFYDIDDTMPPAPTTKKGCLMVIIGDIILLIIVGLIVYLVLGDKLI